MSSVRYPKDDPQIALTMANIREFYRERECTPKKIKEMREEALRQLAVQYDVETMKPKVDEGIHEKNQEIQKIFNGIHDIASLRAAIALKDKYANTNLVNPFNGLESAFNKLAAKENQVMIEYVIKDADKKYGAEYKNIYDYEQLLLAEERYKIYSDPPRDKLESEAGYKKRQGFYQAAQEERKEFYENKLSQPEKKFLEEKRELRGEKWQITMKLLDLKGSKEAYINDVCDKLVEKNIPRNLSKEYKEYQAHQIPVPPQQQRTVHLHGRHFQSKKSSVSQSKENKTEVKLDNATIKRTPS